MSNKKSKCAQDSTAAGSKLTKITLILISARKISVHYYFAYIQHFDFVQQDFIIITYTSQAVIDIVDLSENTHT